LICYMVFWPVGILGWRWDRVTGVGRHDRGIARW
jgi:hypothetical protein